MDQLIAFAAEIQAIPWVRALTAVLVSVLLAKFVDLLISRVVLRLTRRTKTDLDDQLVELLHRPIFISVILIGLQIALETLGWNPTVERVLGALIMTVAVFVWTGAGLRLTKREGRVRGSAAGLSQVRAYPTGPIVSVAPPLRCPAGFTASKP